jgi:hypothetical protein
MMERFCESVASSMIRKSGHRFSEKIMLNQESGARWRFNLIPSRSRRRDVTPFFEGYGLSASEEYQNDIA